MIFPAHSTLSEKTYLTGWLLLAVALPFSNFLMSIAQFVLLAAWLMHGNFNTGFSRLLEHKPALMFILFYCLHLMGLLYTVDFPAGLNDLRVKLPLLLLPFIAAALPGISVNMLRKILLVFAVAVLLQTMLVSLNSAWIFISPIRFSMMAAFSVFILLQESFLSDKHWQKATAALLSCWFVFFLVRFPSDTGIATLAGGMILFLLLKSFRLKNRKVKTLILFSVAGGFAFAALIIYASIRDFYDGSDKEYSPAEFSATGEKYSSYPERKEMESGSYVWQDIAWVELEHAWNGRSPLDFYGKDSTGQPLHVTLIRFLTSKKWKKDAESIRQLSSEEIHAIENGIANTRYMDGLDLSDRLYETVWSIYHYQIGNNPQGNSVSQRFEFWKAGWNAFLQAPLFGYGTGSVRAVMSRQYEKMHSVLDLKFRLKTHNQYLATAVALGSIGFTFLMLAFLIPIFYPTSTYTLAVVFLVITLLAMLVEDTLETQAGVTFVAFFSSLLLLQRTAAGLSEDNDESEQDTA